MKRQGWYDGAAGWTECGIPPYDTFVYDFVVDQEPGTHWWHAHNKAEFVDGLFGAIIVDPPEGVVDPINERWGITPENDQMLFVGDWSHESWEENEQKYLGRQVRFYSIFTPFYPAFTPIYSMSLHFTLFYSAVALFSRASTRATRPTIASRRIQRSRTYQTTRE